MLTKIRKKSVLFDKVFSQTFEHEIFGEKLRYLLIGGSCSVADLLLLYLLVDFLHVWYLAASVISFTLVSLFGYFGQKYFTFKNDSKNHTKQLTIYFLVLGASLLINSLSMFFFVSVVGIWYILASIITKFVVLVWNFMANKYITFKQHSNDSQSGKFI